MSSTEYRLVRRKGRSGYYVQWFDGERSRRKATGTTIKSEAQKFIEDLQADMVTIRDLDMDKSTVRQVLALYYEKHAKNLASAEQVRWAQVLLNKHAGDKRVANLDARTQQNLRRALSDAGKSDGYIKRLFGVLKAAIRCAWNHGKVRNLPIYIRLEVRQERKHRVLSIEELRELYLASENNARLKRFVLWSLATASRPCALYELKHEQVRGGIVSLNPDGREQTDKHRPDVAVPPALAALYEREGASGQFVSEYVLGRKIGSLKKPFALACERAGFAASPYSLRHTVATWLRDCDVSEAQIKGQLGHSLTGVTGRYARWNPRQESTVTNAINELLLKVIYVGEDELGRRCESLTLTA